MAAALLDLRAGGRARARSAGSDPAERLDPVAVEAMAELGVDLGAERPKRITDEAVRSAAVVVTMGCGDACPVYPGKRYVDWELEDPSGKPIEEVRPIRDDLEQRVRTLMAELGVTATS
jgi:protein-tyrosine-phosphatase